MVQKNGGSALRRSQDSSGDFRKVIEIENENSLN
jgi:hypothetical protein